MSIGPFLRRQFDRDPLEHGRLFVAAWTAVCAGSFVFMAGLYAGLSPEDTARESGFVWTLLSPAELMFALPIGFALAITAYGLSLFLPRHALQSAWILACTGTMLLATIPGWAFGPLAILLVPPAALALTALTWLVFPARERA